MGTRLLSSMAEGLQIHGVFPDVVDTLPPSVLDVTYPNNLAVKIGKVLTPTQVKDQPNVQWNGEENAFYTLCMTGLYLFTSCLIKDFRARVLSIIL